MPANESNHTLCALGRGDEAEPLGEFSGYLNPSDLVRIPIGRRLLAATTTTEVRERFAQFALAWDVVGWDTFTPGAARPSPTARRAKPNGHPTDTAKTSTPSTTATGFPGSPPITPNGTSSPLAATAP